MLMDMDLLCKLFDAANMHRWNDHIRPLDLTELDKQAHKAAIAWVLGRSWEQETGSRLDWRLLVEHSLFSFMERVVMTDIKPPLFHRIKAERADEVAGFVTSEVARDVPRLDPGFLERMGAYLRSGGGSQEDGVIRAAHYLATLWEFDLIYDMNRRSVGIEQTRREIEAEIAHHSNIIAVMRRRMTGNDFIDLIGQLRFQQRWTRTPRVPATTVLGHSLLVAYMTYLQDCDDGVDDRTLECAYMHGQSYGMEWGAPGEAVTFIRSRTMEHAPGADNILQTVTALDKPTVRDGAKRLRLTFRDPLPPEIDPAQEAWGIENLTRTPSVDFIGNRIADNRARGALFSTPKPVRCLNNLFDHTSGSAILICGDCNGWYETGAAKDVLIQGNLFVNALTSPFQFTEAVISICPEIPDLAAQKRRLHGDIRITGNTFVAFDAPLVFAKSVDGLTVTGN